MLSGFVFLIVATNEVHVKSVRNYCLHEGMRAVC